MRRTIETLLSEYHEAKQRYHEAKQAHEANPKDVRLQRRMWTLKSKAKWAYKAYNPYADRLFGVSSDKMIEV